MNDPRRVFRLFDVLALVGVVCIVLGLTIPALVAARGVGRRAQCQNNLRGVALGLIGYASAKNHFPIAGAVDDDPRIHNGDPRLSNLYRAVVDPASFSKDPSPLRHSWVVELLPYVDAAALQNGWNWREGYLGETERVAGGPNNRVIAGTAVDILRCPDDDRYVENRGDLSYVVYGGFARWYAIPVDWAGGKSDGQSGSGGVLRWSPEGSPGKDSLAVGKRLAVMFLGSRTGDQPWDVRNGLADVTDGAANTLLVGENTLAGFSEGTPHSGGLPTNWACPFPNFVMFLGSDDVCRSPTSETDCLAGQLRPLSPVGNGPGWKRANEGASPERVNYGLRLSVKGSSPFVSSGHPGGANFAFCDGSVRFLSERIDGNLYALLITPAGAALPPALRQHSFTASGSEPD